MANQKRRPGTRAAGRQVLRTLDQNRSTLLPLLVGNAMLGILGLLTSAFSSQLLGSEGRGELAARQNIPNLLAAFASIGMGEAVVYFSAKRPQAARLITRRAIRLSSFGIAGALCMAPWLIWLLIDDPDTRTGAFWYMLVIPVTVWYTVAYQPLRSLGRTLAWMTFRVGISTAWLAALAVGFILNRPSAQFMAMMFCGIMAIAALLANAIAWRYPGVDGSALPDDRTLYRYALPTAFVAVPQSVNLRLDQVLLVGVVARSDLGIYVAAVGWSWIALPGFTAIAQFVLPKVAAMNEVDRRRWQAKLPVLMWLLGVLTFGALVIPTRLLFAPVMGPEFDAGVGIATMMLAAGVLNGVLLVLEEFAKGLGHPRWPLGAEIGGLFVTVVLLAVLLERFGIRGAASASIAGYGTVALVLTFLIMRTQSGGGNAEGMLSPA